MTDKYKQPDYADVLPKPEGSNQIMLLMADDMMQVCHTFNRCTREDNKVGMMRSYCHQCDWNGSKAYEDALDTLLKGLFK